MKELTKSNRVRNKNVFINKRKQNQRGFGIIEVVVTLFLIGVTLILFQVSSNAIVLNKYNRYKEVALRIAENEIQALKTTSYANLPTTGSFTNSQLSTLPQGAGQLEINEIEGGLTEAIVTVTWNNPSGTDTQQVSLSTYIFQGGLGK